MQRKPNAYVFNFKHCQNKAAGIKIYLSEMLIINRANNSLCWAHVNQKFIVKMRSKIVGFVEILWKLSITLFVRECFETLGANFRDNFRKIRAQY